MLKKIDWKNLAGLAAGALLVCGVSHAQTMDSTTTTTTTTTMDSNMGASAQPMATTGTVVRYYTDRSGYVTAADLQTAEGVRMVRFAPGMGQRLFTTYPVGSQATVYTTSSMMGSGTRMDVVGVGETAPTSFMAPYTASDVQLLEASPYVNIGTKISTVSGTLKGVVTNDMGDVLALVVARGDDAPALVRVPSEFRQTGSRFNLVERAAPLFKNSKIEAVGYEEAPRYGAISSYGTRLIATAITVKGHSVGIGSLPRMVAKKSDTILGFNLFGMGSGNEMSTEQTSAGKMGYMTYDSSTTMAAPATSGDTTMGGTMAPGMGS